MIGNYLKLALRNFWKSKVFSFINIIGLAIGISAALVIYLIVDHDFSFDKHHRDSDRIYRVTTELKFPDMMFRNSGVPTPLPAAIAKEVTGIENTTAFYLFNNLVRVSIPLSGNKQQEYKGEKNIVFADDGYFSIIRYKWLAGSPAVLKQPYQLVLTRSRAEKYFGSGRQPQSFIGQTVYFNDSIQTTVAGIVEDQKEITDFTFKGFISYVTAMQPNLRGDYGFDEWGSVNSSSQFLIKLKTGVTPASVQKQIKAVRDRHGDKNDRTFTNHLLQPLSDIHFNPEYDNFDQRQADMKTLYGLSLVALFLLLLGCINFINLTTAQASQRAKEIGVRKTMGSSRKQLVVQFLTETAMYTAIATVLSILITPWILNIFSDFIPDDLSFSLTKDPMTLVFLAGIMVVVTILSGSYPAMVLARFKPVTVLKNQAFTNTAKTRSIWIRRTLTVSQFVIAQVFIMSTIVVGKQISYSLNKDMGFKKDAIVFMQTPWMEDRDKAQVLANKLRSLPGIARVSVAGSPPASQNTGSQTMKFIDDKKDIETTVEIKHADTNYFKLYQMKLLAGRWLLPADTVREYLVNETYAKFLGFKNPSDIVGRYISRGSFNAPIVGVIADFHTKSTHAPIKPLAYSASKQNALVVHLALQPGGGGAWQNTLKQVEEQWKLLFPKYDFSYEFFDESIARFYKAERNMSSLLKWATGLAIFISCLGLLGLVIYTTNQREKEIGVRKVLGASVSQLVALLSKDFMKLVVLAFIIAAPLTWWGMYKWLQNFAFRTDISWWVFALGGSIMMMIAVVTLSVQTIRSALANPVDSLRNE